MTYLVVVLVAFAASGLTFFSGFGLGTLLLPAFALFFPAEHAVSLTAVVHFLNGLFKLALVARRADLGVVVRFGVPAIVASFAGATVLVWLSGAEPLLTYQVLGRQAQVTPVKLAVGLLLLVFGVAELLPQSRAVSFGPRYLPVGGALSGFFGGVSGHQDALRSAFLVRCGLTKEAFIGTGVVIACAVDAARLFEYGRNMDFAPIRERWLLVAAAIACAAAGAVLAARALPRISMRAIRRFVTVMLFTIAVLLMAGLV
ncbi:MAG: sulfite exporter TauE/SafE family protein [Acidobacteria bacterium]|nr:MAG: sulfite exporter TauE/SafE family protein [Acidobacteriota bacterium]